jgi:putative PIN family toxin of toxin-antitoxin system
LSDASRVVLDTNILVSGVAFPNGSPGKLLALWRAGNLAVVLSHYILEETARVLPRISSPAFDPVDVPQIVNAFAELAEMVVPSTVAVPELRDDADQPVLGTLIAAGAAYLITGDKDLLALAGKYPIVTPAEFWERHG